MNQDIQKESFVEGLKRYRERGIPIYIDGEEAEEQDWSRILEVNEDGSFYMGDYIGAGEGNLTRICFDRIYYK